MVAHGNLGGPFSMAYSGFCVLAPPGVICPSSIRRIKLVFAGFRIGFGLAF